MLQTIHDFMTGLPAYLVTSARVLLILALAGFALRLIPRALRRLHKMIEARQESAEDSRRVQTLSRVIRHVITIAVLVVTGIVILGEFGVSVAPVLGAAGIVGIALSFGAQSLVKDFFSGFFLLLENQIRVGDAVEAGGKSGVVEELTLRYLRLRDYAGNVHYVPNGAISVVTNKSLGFAYAVVNVGIGYGADIDRAAAVMRQVGDALRQDAAFGGRILAPIEIAGVDDLGESAVMIRCRIKVAPLEESAIRREYLRRIKLAFDKEGIEIPYRYLKLVF
ncbi:MAG: mechanosensitive ion channel family protein [Zoogloeaceae bacterium]|nr:mechanosensitive ion channel family protein [Zoogloeaceae bacterium]